jgi:nicotinamide-nucleotide amidase
MAGMSVQAHSLATAEVIAVGSELLTSLRIDTNSLFITDRLESIGIKVVAKAVVGDDGPSLSTLFQQALDRVDLVVLTGGLGPTDDDLTRAVVAEVLGRHCREDLGIIEKIQRRFNARGLKMPEINRRQGLVPDGAVALDNPNGTAPGLWLEHGNKVVLLLPGPPNELKTILQALIEGRLLSLAPSNFHLCRRILRITGRTESNVEEIAQPVYSLWKNHATPVYTTILASLGQIELHLTTSAETLTVGAERLEILTKELVAVLGHSVFSTDGSTLEEIVGNKLVERGHRLAVAESCTGGLLASRLTDTPGSSRYFDLGVVTYSNQAKNNYLGVSPDLIVTEGAVSELVAREMALCARTKADVHAAVAITGILGPGGGTTQKPVGTVAIAVAVSPEPVSRTFHFLGLRSDIKFQATQAALDLLRRELE